MYQIKTFTEPNPLVSVEEQFNKWAFENDETIREVIHFERREYDRNVTLTVLYKTRR